MDKVLQFHNIPNARTLSVTTDGPPAIKGNHRGHVDKLREAGKTELLLFQCIIHGATLCGNCVVTFLGGVTSFSKENGSHSIFGGIHAYV